MDVAGGIWLQKFVRRCRKILKAAQLREDAEVPCRFSFSHPTVMCLMRLTKRLESVNFQRLEASCGKRYAFFSAVILLL